MQNPAQAYGKTARVISNPRQLEAQLLVKSAQQLQAVKEDWKPRGEELAKALTYNRKLWTVFATSVTADDSPLPQDIRENIANLSIFIFKRTLEIQARPEPSKLEALININREIASGLFAVPEQPAQPANA